MYKYLLTLLLAIGLAASAMAQVPKLDTVRNKKDSLNMKRDSATSKPFVPKVKKDNKRYHPDSLHDPHKAVVRSLIIPGWGQLYNHQWYYVPVIYAGLGLLMDAIIFNQNNYKPNLIVAHYYEHGVNPSPGDPQYALWKIYYDNNLQAQTVYDIVASYRRDRDLSILGFLGAWGIQAIHAYVQAKFQHSYTMDTDFSMRITPAIINQQSLFADTFSGPVVPGIKLTILLR
ncbi:MAG: DUF5683 domain-containing protein [Mucilaginibacter sp.]